MSWKCPCCGFEANTVESRNCEGGCGYVRLEKTVILSSTSTEKEIALSVDTIVGTYLLRSFAGDDAAFASEPQFKIYKNMAVGSWSIQHFESARNPTFHDGLSVVAEPSSIQEGSIISIGPERMKLTVRFVD